MEENVKIEILKAAVKNDRLEVTYRESFTDENYSNEVSKKCSQIVHSDLKAAMDQLKAHLAVICEQPEASIVRAAGIYEFNTETLDNYVVRGYSAGGTDESAGVTIIGQKLLNDEAMARIPKGMGYSVCCVSGAGLTDKLSYKNETFLIDF